uniref:Calcineurin-like phosphoesterase domain-containing protein n=1 Tax=Nelumbo nucifera TaxID=4432 RepID=A0A822ZPQ3_NELNU|nr:TPA_asm: hypothetical protein HUJ06_017159 [Nelumbo nucifera]
MSVLPSTEYMGFMTSAREGLMSAFGRHLQIASTACQWLLLLMTRSFACMEDCPLTLKNLDQIRNIARPVDVPDQGLLRDLWSDPDKDIQGWIENDRGVSYTFGADKVTEFLQKHDLDLICRAHQ